MGTNRTLILWTTLLVLCATSSVKASQITLELQEAMLSAPEGEFIPVIIRLADQADISPLITLPKKERRQAINKALRDKAAQTQESLLQFIRSSGIEDVRSLWIINALIAELPAYLIDELVQHPSVERIFLDRAIQLPPVNYQAATPTLWNLVMIRADDLWSAGIHGQGVVVAIMDSGVDVDHPDLNANYRGGSNSWFDTYGEHTTPYDPDGHGTMVAGIIAGQGQTGIARDVQWIAVKMYADSGSGTVSDVHRGFQWLLNPDGDDNTDDAPDIINNSWDIKSTVSQCIRDYDFEDDFRIFEAEGIALVFGAGNEGRGGPQTGTVPGTYEETFAVGSVDEYSNISDYSSRGPSPCYDGPFPNLAAPGQDIVSTFLSDGGSSNYFTASGTSFAAPHVAGAMALLMSALPNATPDELESALEWTTVDRGAPGPDYDYGHGILDVAAAYESLTSLPPEPEEVIIDNRGIDCRSKGTWLVSSGKKPYGADSVYNKVAGDWFEFNAQVAEAGYLVYVHWTTLSGRSTDVEVVTTTQTANGARDVLTSYVNQKRNGGKWNLIGLAKLQDFVAVTIYASGKGSTCADAVKLAPFSESVINIDNGDVLTGSTGTWRTSGASGSYGSTSLYSKTVGAEYIYSLPLDGADLDCSILARWTTWPSRSTKVPIEIWDGSKLIKTVIVNQKENGGQWITIMPNVRFTDDATVKIISESSTASTCADAVRFAAPRALQSIEIVGPTEVGDEMSPHYNEYNIIATYEGGYTDETKPQNWYCDLPGTSFDENGCLTVPNVTVDTPAVITAEYTAGGITRTDTYQIVVCDGVVPIEVIIDNRDSDTSSTGNWYVSGAADPWGQDSLYSKTQGATFTFHADLAGVPYVVYERRTAWSSRSKSVPVEMTTGGQLVFSGVVNQKRNTAKWNFTGIATLGQDTRFMYISSGKGSTCVDAVKFTPLSMVDEIIIDNGDTQAVPETGTWRTSSAPDPYGANSLWNRTPGDSYLYVIPKIDVDETFDLYARWTNWPSRSTSVPIFVEDGDRLAQIPVNQKLNGGQWNLILGDETFGDWVFVSIVSTSSEYSTCADAIKLVPVR